MMLTCVNFEFVVKYKYQILSVLAVNLITFSQGLAVGWLAPTLLLLQSDDSPLSSGKLSVEEASWVGSLVCIGGIIGSFTFGLLVHKFGPKKTLFLLVIPHLCFWIILIFGMEVWHLYIARILSGITGGGTFITIPTFVTDIADNKIRGTLGSGMILFFNGGIFSGFILASYLSYSLYPRVAIVLSAVFVLSISSLPETPQHLIKVNNDEEAENSLRFYRNYKGKSKEEIEEFHEYLNKIKARIRGTTGNEVTKLTCYDFLKPSAVRGFTIGVGLMFLNQFSGLFAIVTYTSTIFQMSGSNMDPNTCTIIVGAIQFLGTFVTTYLVDRVGRKILLIVSCLGVAVGSFTLSMFSYFSVTQNLSHISWLAVLSMSITILLGSFGLLPLPFVVLTEVLPQKVRAVGVTLCMSILTLMAFIVLKIYPAMMVGIGIYGTMWISTCITIVGALFIFFFLPETKGKCLEGFGDN